MRLAVPEHLGRRAPVFDCCRRVMVFQQRSLEDEVVHSEDWTSVPKIARATRLRDLRVELLLCGGISCWMEEEVRRHGIRLMPWVAGDVWDVLAALREGRISDPKYAMPGRVGCARRHRGPRCAKSTRSFTLSQKERKNA